MLKKIKTKQDIEKINKRNQLIIGVVLIGLLLLSTVGYSVFSGDGSASGETAEENGIRFSKINGFWRAKINGLDFNFQYLPSEVSDVPVRVSFRLNDYSGATVYFVNPNAASTEVLNNLNAYILRYQEACLEGSTCNKTDIPIKSCSEKMIIYQNRNETAVSQVENCIYLEGEEAKAADAFLYKILDIN